MKKRGLTVSRLKAEPLAAAAVGAFVVCCVAWLSTGILARGLTAESLAQAGAASGAREDYASALIWYQRLMVDDPADDRGLVGFADTLDQLGRRAQALDTLITAAPPGTTDHASAHHLIARLLLDEYTLGTQRDPASLETAATHLRPLAERGDAEAAALLQQIEALR